MLSIEALIQRIIFFVKRYLYTFSMMLVRPAAVMRAIQANTIQESTDTDASERKYTNPHVYFILSLFLVCAQLETLKDLQNKFTPLGFWDISSDKLVLLLSINLFNQSFFDTSLHTVPVAIIYYCIIYFLAFLAFRHKKYHKLFVFSFMFWMGTMLITFFVLYFIVPSLLFHTLRIDYNTVNAIIMCINLTHSVFFLCMPVYATRLLLTPDSGSLFLRFGILSFVVCFSIWYIGNLYLMFDRSIDNPSIKNVYFLSKPSMTDDKFCITYNSDSTTLSAALVLVNQSENPMYIEHELMLDLHVYHPYYEQYRTVKMSLDSIFGGVASKGAYIKIEPKGLFEMYFVGKIDSARTVTYEGYDIHYQTVFPAIYDGKQLAIEQRWHSGCVKVHQAH